MSKINYDVELFNLLKDLTAINNSIIFEKDEEKNVVVRRIDSESTMAYHLSAPSNYFEFNENEIAFYNYSEFYQYFNALSQPEISIEDKNIILTDGNSKTNYLLSNPESIPAGPKTINFKDPDIRINITSAELDELLKMIGLINSKKIKICGNNEFITFNIFNNVHDNTFEKTFKVEKLSNNTDDIDFVIFADTFKNLPARKDYIMEIKAIGAIKIALKHDKVKLELYTGRIKN